MRLLVGVQRLDFLSAPRQHDVRRRREVFGARGGVIGRVVMSLLFPLPFCSPMTVEQRSSAGKPSRMAT